MPRIPRGFHYAAIDARNDQPADGIIQAVGVGSEKAIIAEFPTFIDPFSNFRHGRLRIPFRQAQRQLAGGLHVKNAVGIVPIEHRQLIGPFGQ